MCGIVGAYLQSGSVVESLVEGLRVLEYRGYDSSGIGVIGDRGEVQWSAHANAVTGGMLNLTPFEECVGVFRRGFYAIDIGVG